jgi:hypothetical protein
MEEQNDERETGWLREKAIDAFRKSFLVTLAAAVVSAVFHVTTIEVDILGIFVFVWLIGLGLGAVFEASRWAANRVGFSTLAAGFLILVVAGVGGYHLGYNAATDAKFPIYASDNVERDVPEGVVAFDCPEGAVGNVECDATVSVSDWGKTRKVLVTSGNETVTLTRENPETTVEVTKGRFVVVSEVEVEMHEVAWQERFLASGQREFGFGGWLDGLYVSCSVYDPEGERVDCGVM